jgi:predicted kinase
MNIELTARKLYIVSAPAGVGKSTLLKGVNEFVVSADALRDQMLGNWVDDDGRIHRYEHQNTMVHEVLFKMVSARAKERLTTFVDATNRTEPDRLQLATLARQYGQEVEVLILDLPMEDALLRNQQRPAPIPDEAIKLHYEQFVKTSELPHRVIDMTQGHTLSVAPERIPDDVQLDVIGDVHGLYDDLLELLSKLGYIVEQGSAPSHPDGRKLLFLGDFVDRGQQSLEVLELLYRAVKAGHYALLGNHEMKLVRFWKARNLGQETKLSLSSAETAMAFARLPKQDQDRLGTFLQFLPTTYVWKDVGFAHANLVQYDPVRTPASELLFGIGKHGEYRNTDDEYCQLYEADINKYKLVRGHIEPTGVIQRQHIISLEDRQAYRGNLVALDISLFRRALNDDGIWAAMSYLDVLKACTTTQKCEFDFDEHIQPKVGRIKGLGRLESNKLVMAAKDETATLKLWKYTKQVFYNKMWSHDPLLLKSRGLVLDIAGNVVVHPFDKVFNFGEEGAGKDVADETEVVVPEKLNGFLGVVSPHPHKKDLLVTTTGSFDSPFVGYIKDYLPGYVAGRVLQYFHHNGPLTLSL